MGYKDSGEPISLTFIGKQFSEANFLRMGKSFEDLTKVRKMPAGYME
jgi:amidase